VKRRFLAASFFCFLLAPPLAGLAPSAAAVDEVAHLQDALQRLAEMPAVSGCEERVSAWLASRLQPFRPQVDNLGNVTVTLGTGAPHRLLVTAVDEPGYVVSGITDDGFLQVQRLPQRGVHPWFELMHSAQPVQMLVRDGRVIPGVVAGLSTHLQPGREAPAAHRTDHLDRIYIDVGARSRQEVLDLGLDLLDPLTLEKHAYALAKNQMAAPFLGDRAGAAVLLRLVEGMDPRRLTGTVTVAFVVRRYLGNQGLNRLLETHDPDEVIFVQSAEKTPVEPGAGLLVAAVGEGSTAFGAELLAVAAQHGIRARGDVSAPAPRGRYTGLLPLPERTTAVSVGVAFPQSPAEVVSVEELARLEELLAIYLGVAIGKAPTRVHVTTQVEVERDTDSSTEEILKVLSEAYGVSGHEQAVVTELKKLLPLWALEWATVDAAGNLLVPFGRTSKKPSLVFVAHTDEIGWVVREIAEDGRLVLDPRGGFLDWHFLSHVVLVHTARGRVPAVLQLPEGYQSEKYEADRDRAYVAYTGARSRGESEALGIAVGDWVTVPKKYRKLASRRVSARSFDDRVGSTALVAALWQIDPEKIDREVIFLWATREEIGLEGAKHFAARAAATGGVPEFVFAVDTFVSGDSPLESPRFAGSRLGEGIVLRAVDNSNVTPRQWVSRVLEIAGRHNIPAQYGVTGGGNDGAAFVPYGSVDIPLGWSLRYSHSATEVVDLKDVEALARIVAALALEF
jgi:putative aminopeptidase FrvX